ncbi:fibronectin type III domain-containing protein [Flagellimonas meridianipacifica]|uniref:Fibronectin type III domain protein n=1 Tax=Flagellimonas meridianipacifica TaxID=1080225 RepID=A0A2T0MHY5_9FLAO|nr:fibronectin type III domain-containing protein [Allomuricauda pacifica]PRX57198.1 fibronectin type III domain protein [Allomuricauda pacifica]
MKKLIVFFTALSCSIGFGQTNLLDDSTWSIGTGSVAGFPKYGTDAESVRSLGLDPFGDQSVLWRCITEGTGGSSGGWFSDAFTIDHTKTYRLTVWMKKLNSPDGSEVFGTYIYDSSGNHTAIASNGSTSSNPIFNGGDAIQSLNTWYLFVSYIHHSGYSGAMDQGKVYDVNGNIVSNIDDFKSSSNSVSAKHRAYYWQGFNSVDELILFKPTVYEVNGQEPSIQELLNGPNGNSDSQSPTTPTLSSTGQSETTIDLSWSGATDNVGVTGYKMYKDNILETTLGNVSSYQVVGLSASTTYQFKIRALDAAGNESGDSNIVSVTTDPSSGSGGNSGSGSVWSEDNAVASYTGSVAVGRSSVPSGYKMAVEGKIRTREVRVDQDNWPDYVFRDDYELPSLEEIQKHITEKGHLPNIPSATEVEEMGVELGEMNKLLLEKIEELTLYILELKKENDAFKIRLEELESKEQPK